MLIKLLGIRYQDPVTPVFDGSYISNLCEITSGDVLADKDGNPITFGVVPVPYDVEPPDGSLSAGDTKFWFNIYTNTVWSKTKKLDTTVVSSDLGLAGTDIMLKSLYDTNADGIVNFADALKAGATVVTASGVNTHITTANIHTPLNDTIVTTSNLWSADKINVELSTKSPTTHTHASFNGSAVGFVPVPAEQSASKVLRTDGTWDEPEIELGMLTDVHTEYAGVADILTYSGGGWMPCNFATDDSMSIVFDPFSMTFHFAAEQQDTLVNSLMY